MKYLLFFFLILLLIFHLGSVRFFDEVLVPGQELDILVNVVNYDTKDLENVKVTIFIPEMSLFFRTTSFDVEDRDIIGKVVFEDIPKDVNPGDYLVKVSIDYYDENTKKDRKESVYRYITIV